MKVIINMKYILNLYKADCNKYNNKRIKIINLIYSIERYI